MKSDLCKRWCDVLPPLFWFIFLKHKQYYDGRKYTLLILCDFCLYILCPLHSVQLDFGKSNAYVFVCICGTVQSLCPLSGRSKFSVNTRVQRLPTLCQRTGDNVYVCLCGTINIQVYLPGRSAKTACSDICYQSEVCGKTGV